nr:hypothetical protein GCM10025699_21260 [Microbacterium flavescens]
MFPKAEVMSEWMPVISGLSAVVWRVGTSLGGCPCRESFCDMALARARYPAGHRLDGPMASPDSPLTVAVLLRRAAARLADAGVPDPDVDAELLAAFVLQTGRGRVQAAPSAATAFPPILRSSWTP